jgi:hypothetical protein
MSLVFENIFSSEHSTKVYELSTTGVDSNFIEKMVSLIKDCSMPDVDFEIVEVNMSQPATFFGSKKTCKMLKVTSKVLPKYEAYYKASADGKSVTFFKYETMVKGFFDTLSNKTPYEIEINMRKSLGLIEYEKYISLTMTMDILFKKAIFEV